MNINIVLSLANPQILVLLSICGEYLKMPNAKGTQIAYLVWELFTWKSGVKEHKLSWKGLFPSIITVFMLLLQTRSRQKIVNIVNSFGKMLLSHKKYSDNLVAANRDVGLQYIFLFTECYSTFHPTRKYAILEKLPTFCCENTRVHSLPARYYSYLSKLYYFEITHWKWALALVGFRKQIIK